MKDHLQEPEITDVAQNNLALCEVSEASSLCPLGKEQSEDTSPTQRNDVAVGREAGRRIDVRV
jgi:hypothetical protein